MNLDDFVVFSFGFAMGFVFVAAIVWEHFHSTPPTHDKEE